MPEQFSLPGFDAPPPRRERAPHAASPKHGLFFGILPAAADLPRFEAVAMPLRQRHGMTRGKVAAHRLHITCCDLGGFAEAPLQSLLDAAVAVASGPVWPRFEVSFGQVMRFKGNAALVLVENDGPTALTAFCNALGQALVQAGVPVDFGGRPHMTLAYGGSDVSEPLAEPVRWVAQDFVLIDSLVGDSEHRQLGRWPLVAQP